MDDSGRPEGPFGGQALIEGVMIRGPRSVSIALRMPDGLILTESQVVAPFAGGARRVPFVRGVLALYDTFALGIRALYRSARVAQGQNGARASRADIGFAAVVIAAAALVFFTGPVLLTSWIGDSRRGDWIEVVAEGVLRLAMLVGYVWFIGRLPEVQRVFAYHGAEHRTVHAYEHGHDLTLDAVRGFPNAHPRCGTAFLLTVAALSFGAFLALGTPSLPERVIERIVLTPLIAALAYEVLHASHALERHGLVRLLIRPSIWLQRWTTRDPDDGQIEVAIAAMQAAIATEQAALIEAVPLPAPADVPVSAPDGSLDM